MSRTFGLIEDGEIAHTITLYATEAEMEKRMLELVNEAGIQTTMKVTLEDAWIKFQDSFETPNRYVRFSFDRLPNPGRPVECS